MMPLDATTQTDDASLLALFAQGDATAARILTNRLAPVVYAHAYRMLNNRAEAEDTTQEALLRLWKAAPDWQPHRARVTTWLYRVTANLCIDRLRLHKRISGDEAPDLADDAPSVVQNMHAKSRADALQDALQTLPDRQRQAVILRHIQDLSNPEIADIMDISVEAVESLTSRGKRALAALLTPQKPALGLSDGP